MKARIMNTVPRKEKYPRSDPWDILSVKIKEINQHHPLNKKSTIERAK